MLGGGPADLAGIGVGGIVAHVAAIEHPRHVLVSPWLAPARCFPIGNGGAIAREIPGARLLVLEQAATTIPDAATGRVAAAMLALGRRPAGLRG